MREPPAARPFPPVVSTVGSIGEPPSTYLGATLGQPLTPRCLSRRSRKSRGTGGAGGGAARRGLPTAFVQADGGGPQRPPDGAAIAKWPSASVVVCSPPATTVRPMLGRRLRYSSTLPRTRPAPVLPAPPLFARVSARAGAPPVPVGATAIAAVTSASSRQEPSARSEHASHHATGEAITGNECEAHTLETTARAAGFAEGFIRTGAPPALPSQPRPSGG